MKPTTLVLLALLLSAGTFAAAHAGTACCASETANAANAGQGTVESAAVASGSTVKPAAEVYPLETCPISGEKLGDMGEPHVIALDGVSVQLCCDGCEKKARSRKDTVKAAVRDALVKRDGPSYPFDDCASCGMKLKKGGMDMVQGSTLVKICGDMCRDSFASKGAELALKVRTARAVTGTPSN